MRYFSLMRILYFSEQWGGGYGQERALETSLKLLKGVDCIEFAVVCRKNEPAAVECPVYSIPDVFALPFFDPHFRVVQIYERIQAIVENWKPDILHLNEQLDYRLMNLLCRLKPIVLTSHTFATTCPASDRKRADGGICGYRSGLACFLHYYTQGCLSNFNAFHGKFMAILSHQLRTKVSRNRISIFAVSQTMQRYLMGEKWDLKYLHQISHPIESEIKLTPRSGDLILMASRLTPLKGHKNAFLALKQIESIPWEVAVVGSGSLEEELKKCVESLGLEDRIHFYGHCSAGEMTAWRRKARIYLQPNIGPETFGLSVAEALGAGLAVIASKVDGISEVVRDGETGWLVKPGSVDDLQRVLREVLLDPKRGDARGVKGWKDMKERFSPSRHVEQVLAAYRQVLELAGVKLSTDVSDRLSHWGGAPIES